MSSFAFKGFDARFGVFNMSLLALSPEPAKKSPKKCPTSSLRCWILLLEREDFHYFFGKLKVENMIKIIH
jgi:hypothetical protein